MLKIVTLFITITLSCTSQNIDSIVTNHINNLKQFDIINNKKEVIFIQERFKDFYDRVQNNWSKYNEEQSQQAINILTNVTSRDTINHINRVKVVEFYTTLLTSDSLGVRSSVLTPLTLYKLNDYNKSSKDNIEKLFTSDNESYLRAEIYKLAGFLQLKKAEDYLTERYFNKKEKVDKWNAMLSLARMGNKRAIDFCIEELEKMIQKIKNSSDLDLISESAVYIRSYKSLDILIKLFNLNKEISGISKPHIKFNIKGSTLDEIIHSTTNFPEKLYKIKEIPYEKEINEIENWLKRNKDDLILNRNDY